MIKLNVYLVDDASVPMELLERYVEKTPELHLAGKNDDPEKALAALLGEQCEADVVFLDIEMPRLNGLELARYLEGRYKIVFTTGHDNFGPEAYELKAVDYLLKPISYPRFLKAVKEVQERIKSSAVTAITIPKSPGEDAIYIPGDGKADLVCVEKSNILFIKTEGNYLRVVTKDQEYLSYTTLKGLEPFLQSPRFLRIHRSYLINMKQIKKVSSYSVILKDSSELPVSSTYREEFMALINAARPLEPG